MNKISFTNLATTNAIRRNLTSKIFYLLMMICAQLHVLAQNIVIPDKVDPAFRAMINFTAARNINRVALPPHFNLTPTEGFAVKDGSVEKRYESIVYTKNVQALRDSGIIVHSALAGFATAWVTLEQVVQLSLMPQVTYIEASKMSYPHNDVVVGSSGASLLQQGKLNNTSYKGKNVIVAIYDTGIDWDHFDFRDPNDTTKSRILRIWDQTITARTGEAPPSGFAYGVEYTQAQINDEIDGSPANVVRERDIYGHGTHVAGTSAGNGSALSSKKYAGMAPEADIIVVKGSDSSFSDSRIIDGLTYLKNLAAALGKPIVVNMSLGGQYGPHDGTRAMEVAVDSFSSVPGRVVVISAGNDNNTNIHNRILIPSMGNGSASFVVPDSTAPDVFEYDLYANDSSNITATITVPGGATVTSVAGQTSSKTVLSDSFYVYLANTIDAGSKNRYIQVYVSRNGNNTRSPVGTWTLSLTNNTANTLTMDGWLDYKNAAFSATTLTGGNSDYLVGSPGTASSAITAAAYVGKNNWYSSAVPSTYTWPTSRIDSIAVFSSRGPRRDGVLKPDIASPGDVVVSSLSSDALAYHFPPYSIVEKGLYAENRGTSMAAPGVTGAVALLLQANPTATASQIKGLITATGSRDGLASLAGPVPNTTWGYGRLDVFKAASLLFNCGPAERKLFKYDSSTIRAQEAGNTFTSHRVAVRFTPDISGKLGGVFFHTISTIANLFVEVRTNIAGSPGTLLGTVNIDSTSIGKNAMNYLDLSNLNITVTSGTDFFIVVARALNSTAGWSLLGENVALDSRSSLSFDGGFSWSVYVMDYEVRSIVYNDAQLAGGIATINSADTRNLNSSNQFINSGCQLIDQVVPTGLNPVSGTVTSKVWIESSVPVYAGNPFVQRHYELTPPGSAATATARVTLYFKQSEFDLFNSNPASIRHLPTGPVDAAGKANLRVGKYAGISSDSSGLPGSYNSTVSLIDPADGDILWNASTSRWEVSFDVTGFIGFIVQTALTILPVITEYFKGNSQGTANILDWMINCTNGSVAFEIQRSNNGISFSDIGTLDATAGSCTLPFSFKDAAPMAGLNYYRIKITSVSGETIYTNTLLLQTGMQLITRLYPTIIKTGSPVQVSLGSIKGYLSVYDAIGKQVSVTALTKGVQSINLHLPGRGIYFYAIKDDGTVLSTGKIIVE